MELWQYVLLAVIGCLVPGGSAFAMKVIKYEKYIKSLMELLHKLPMEIDEIAKVAKKMDVKVDLVLKKHLRGDR